MAEHRRTSFTVLHGLWADEPGFVAVTVARLLRVPAIVSVMGGELVALRDIGYGGRLAMSNRLLSRVALRGATRLTAASAQPIRLARQFMQPAHRSRIARLVWGIDPCLFQREGPRFELAGERSVLHVGSLVRIKDQATLLRAIARVRETESEIHLHVMGDGPLRGHLTRQVQDLGLTSCVTFHGHVDRRELAAYYRAADVVAVSSLYEAQLVVALEAALCGTPIVGTAVGLVAEFAPEAAVAVPVGDDRGLAAAIRAVLVPGAGAKLGMAARRLVESDYIAANTAERLIAMYGGSASSEAAT
jgi:glycosyltransferase involved in cell wall biosynthesis